MKIERSSFLKKRRADFIAGYLKGRIIVAGGLGEGSPSPSSSSETTIEFTECCFLQITTIVLSALQ